MSKPTDTARWATNVNTTVQPSESKKSAGYVAGEQPSPGEINWLFNKNYQWQAYLNNLHNEVDFLNKPYAWQNVHSWLLAYAQDFTAINLRTSTDPLFTAPKSSVLSLPRCTQLTTTYIETVTNQIQSGWRVYEGKLVTDIDEATAEWELNDYLSTGCVVTGYTIIGWHKGTTGLSGKNMRAELIRTDENYGALNPPVVSAPIGGLQSSTVDGSGAGLGVVLSVSGLNEAIDRATKHYTLRVYASGGPSDGIPPGDQIWYALVSFTNPGPARND